MAKYLTLHPQYFLKEGFGTLMSHYAVMYSLYRDTGIIPVVMRLNFKEQNLTSAMEGFNNFNTSIIYHSEAFINFDKIFITMYESQVSKYNWYLKDYSSFTYNNIVHLLKYENANNICCLWSLNSNMIQKYLNDIINNLYIFNTKIIDISKKYLPITNKNIVGICVRNEYKKFICPHIKLSINFYEHAMNQFDKNNTKYLIFSDDIEECKQIFKKLEDTFDISYTEPMQSAIGMCAMSMCDHIICANSSFSYWASLLNTKSNKKIICPTKFIDDRSHPNLAQMLNYKWYPDSWCAIDIC